MTNPLEGLDPEDQRMLAKLAEDKGITLLEARKLHDETAKKMRDYFLKLMAERGITKEDIEKVYESERWAIEHIYNTTGVKFPGIYSIAYAADSGERVLTGASRGHVKTHGSAKDKNERWNNYKNLLEEKMANNPHLNVTEARRRVANEVGVSLKTIERHTRRK